MLVLLLVALVGSTSSEMMQMNNGMQQMNGGGAHTMEMHEGQKGSGPRDYTRQVYHWEPKFVRNLTQEAQTEFNNIVDNSTATFTAQKQALTAWATKYNVQNETNQYFNNVTTEKATMLQNITQIISTLVAKNQELDAILNNEDQSRTQLAQALMTFRNSSAIAFDMIFHAFEIIRMEQMMARMESFENKHGQQQMHSVNYDY